jgi:hypothetical protein
MKYSKTEAGQLAFKARSTQFSARQRSAFILFDGLKTNDQVLTATTGLGIGRDDIEHLVQLGFLVAATDSVAPSASASSEASAIDPEQQPSLPVSVLSPQQRYSAAMPIATKLTAALGLRGFRLNLAVEAASGFDGLLALLPKIQEAVGAKSCVALEQALKG